MPIPFTLGLLAFALPVSGIPPNSCEAEAGGPPIDMGMGWSTAAVCGAWGTYGVGIFIVIDVGTLSIFACAFAMGVSTPAPPPSDELGI
ncbi:hypothetical protein CPB84DRAFT_1772663, partial [Gymnopilus junonius]